MTNLLSRRERQIMDIVHERGEVTAADVVESLPDPPSYSAVRALIRILEEKGHLTHKEDGKRYVFRATESHQTAAVSALQRIVQTFFKGSTERAVATLISSDEINISEDELNSLSELIESAKRKGKSDA